MKFNKSKAKYSVEGTVNVASTNPKYKKLQVYAGFDNEFSIYIDSNTININRDKLKELSRLIDKALSAHSTDYYFD